MIDRLIKLIKASSPNTIEGLAEDLLAAGVIVPPCKVGDTVYVMESEFTGFWECEIINMFYDGVQWLGRLSPLRKYHTVGRGYWRWEECEFGKTIFLTKEEAEHALAERNDSDG